MVEHNNECSTDESEFHGLESARKLLDKLFEDSRLYSQSKDYKELLEFVVRLRNFAPFNAMLLQIQKPGLSYAASACDWNTRFGRTIKAGARPLLILWPFGPVALVYDVLDTEGDPLPSDAFKFIAQGNIDHSRLALFKGLLARKSIEWICVDSGDRAAGSIRVRSRAPNNNEYSHYQIHINRNHEPPTQFTTLVHELAHLCLGHLGPDKKLNIPQRPALTPAQRELEAESVAYIVCERNGVESRSQPYLSSFLDSQTSVDSIDIYSVMRATGQVESVLGLAGHTQFTPP